MPLGNVHWGAQTFQPTLLCFAQITIQAFTCPGCVQPAWVYTSIPSFRTANNQHLLVGYEEKFLTRKSGAALAQAVRRGSGVSVHGGVHELWGCGTGGHGQWRRFGLKGLKGLYPP